MHIRLSTFYASQVSGDKNSHKRTAAVFTIVIGRIMRSDNWIPMLPIDRLYIINDDILTANGQHFINATR